MNQAGHPRAERPASDREQTDRAEDGAVVRAFEHIRWNGAEHRSHPVSDQPLHHHHEAQKRENRPAGECDQQEAAHDKSGAADGPYEFAAHPIGKPAKRNLSGHACKTHHAKCPGSERRVKPDLEQIAGLVNLHRIPDEERTGVTERDPPEAVRANR